MHDHRTDGVPAVPPANSVAGLRDWLCARLAEELGLPAESIDPAEPMAAYGLDSVRAIILLADVEKRLGREIDPNALWEFPTVDAFAARLGSPDLPDRPEPASLAPRNEIP
jgi:acyl carrier protein